MKYLGLVLLLLLALATPAWASFPTVQTTNSGGTGSTDTTSHTVNLPTGIASGDLLLLFFAVQGGNQTVTWPAGYTKAFETASGVDANNDVTFSTYYRVADGTEGSTITVTTSASKSSAHETYRITGYSSTPVSGTASTSASTLNPNPPSLTPGGGAKDFLWFAVAAVDSGNATCDAFPTNYINTGSSNGGTGGSGAIICFATRAINGATEDPGSFTICCAIASVANTVAIVPAAAATNTKGIGWGFF